jgi:hypothetical protein
MCRAYGTLASNRFGPSPYPSTALRAGLLGPILPRLRRWSEKTVRVNSLGKGMCGGVCGWELVAECQSEEVRECKSVRVRVGRLTV